VSKFTQRVAPRVNQISHLPPHIGVLCTLEVLAVSSNKIITLPKEIGFLSSLKKLYLEHNEISKLPSQLGDLQGLHILNLSYNKLTSIPKQVLLLNSLERLYLQFNSIPNLPPEIGELKRINELYLSSNKLTSIPKEISLLTTLRILRLDNNRISKIPPEIGKCTCLRELSFSYNEIKWIPKELANCCLLSSLEIKLCSFLWLFFLTSFIRNTPIVMIPPSLASHKIELYIEGSSFLYPPHDFLRMESYNTYYLQWYLKSEKYAQAYLKEKKKRERLEALCKALVMCRKVFLVMRRINLPPEMKWNIVMQDARGNVRLEEKRVMMFGSDIETLGNKKRLLEICKMMMNSNCTKKNE